MKIGLLGGCFDPITKSHINAANLVLSKNIVDKVLIIPAYYSLNGKNFVAESQHRLNMCNIAIQKNNDSRIELSDFEIKNQLTGTSFEIIKSMKNYYNWYDDKLYFIIGEDNAQKLKLWTDYDGISKLVKFIVIPRQGYNKTDLSELPENCIYLESNQLPGSSSQVRENLENNKNLLCVNVLEYIEKNNLYK